jgi:hypothetical protein
MKNAEVQFILGDIIKKLSHLVEALEEEHPQIVDIPTIPFKDNKEFVIPQEWLDDWFLRYGELFVRRELVKISNWGQDNPDKQKYAGKGKGKPRAFIGNWLSRAADKSGRFVAPASTAKKYARKYSQ